jgi:hypothetical protein
MRGPIRHFAEVLGALLAPDKVHDIAWLVNESPWEANRDIMEGYFAISNALGVLLHGDHGIPENATFPTFAVWTTETLRSEVDRGGYTRQPYAFFRPARRIYKRTARVVLRDDEVIARNIARGEAAIYEEIGPAIHHLIKTIVDHLHPLVEDRELPSSAWQQIWEDYGSKLIEESERLSEHQRYPDQYEAVASAEVTTLQHAIQPYFEVVSKGLSRWDIDAAERKERAELILLGNVRCEAYAQYRLQPVLERNLAYIPDAIRMMIGSRLMGRNTTSSQLLRRAYRRVEPAAEVIDEGFRIAATRHAYLALIGDEELRLGRDLPVPPPANLVLRGRQPQLDQERYGCGDFFPYSLQTLDNSAIWAAWQQYDRSSGDGTRTAVDSWLRYEERMSYLVNLFRSRQQLTGLYGMPRSIRRPEPSRPASAVTGDGQRSTHEPQKPLFRGA